MSADHERAKALAAAEVAMHGYRLPLTRRQGLRDLVWATADTDERAALRAEYALAGWARTSPACATPSRRTKGT